MRAPYVAALAGAFGLAAGIMSTLLVRDASSEARLQEYGDLVSECEIEASETAQRLAENAADLRGCVDTIDAFREQMAGLERDGCLAAIEERLHEVFDDVRRYREGANAVNLRYVKSFLVDGRSVTVTMALGDEAPVRPGFRLVFLNMYGVVTAEARYAWLVDEIRTGETRVDEVRVERRAGPARYWTIYFD